MIARDRDALRRALFGNPSRRTPRFERSRQLGSVPASGMGVDTSSYTQFRQDYLLLNVPAILPPSVTAHWAAFSHPTRRWSSSLSATIPDYDNISSAFGQLSVTDNLVRSGPDLLDDSVSQLPSTLTGLLALWAAGRGRHIYLKDFHLPRILGEQGRSVEAELYTVPPEWEDDWANTYWAENGDDFRFLYCGGGDTFTPLHRDVFSSYSISTNLFGVKLWTLFPPACAEDILRLLKEAERCDEGDGSVDVRSWSPQTRQAFEEKGMVEVRQEAGETIFVSVNTPPKLLYS